MTARQPDLLIGVDFGMTCTGVSYANLNRSKAIRTIQNWPGRMQANENKVPTILSYTRSTRQLSKWGFEAESPLERENPDREPVDWFKVLLDESSFKQMQNHDASHAMPESLDMVERWFMDYLEALYKHIEYRLSAELPLGTPWSNALIEFIFSVPTTWHPQPTVERFRSICARAGFAQHRTHSIAIGLTEAEAAAVHTSIEAPRLFKTGDVLLVCDIGGGTTDLSVLKVKGLQMGNMQLEQMDVVQGRTIGSAKIDEAFQNLATQRLMAAQSILSFQGNPKEIAWRMMKSREFQNAKCDFGSPDDTPIFAVPTFGIDVSYQNPQFNMLGGAIQFGRSEMQNLFDTKMVDLYAIIDQQITQFKRAHATEKISHIILSGGLGNSAYVQERLRQKYSLPQWNAGPIPSSSPLDTIQVHVAPEPQLAVCKGILADRIAILSSGTGVLPWRCARASYGMLCRVKYNPFDSAHVGKKTEPDPFTNELYVNSCIEWFIKKGEAVNSSTPIVRPFMKKIRPGPETKRTFPSSVVISYLDADKLPLQINQDAYVVADIVSDLSDIPETDFKLKNRHWWNSGKKYRRCEYSVKVIIGAADILFELWFRGQKLSKDKPMPVDWMDAPAPSGSGDGSYNDISELPPISISRQVGKNTLRLADGEQRHGSTSTGFTGLASSQGISSNASVPTQSSVHSASPALTHSIPSNSPGISPAARVNSSSPSHLFYPQGQQIPELMNSNLSSPRLATETGQHMSQVHEMPQMAYMIHGMPQRQGTIYELPQVSSPVPQMWIQQQGMPAQLHELPSNYQVNSQGYPAQQVQIQNGFVVQRSMND